MANVNLQNIKFPELLSCDVKRLTRPRFNHEFTQFNDRQAFTRMSGEAEAESRGAQQTVDLLSLDAGDNNVDAAAADTGAEGRSIEILDIEEDYDP